MMVQFLLLLAVAQAVLGAVSAGSVIKLPLQCKQIATPLTKRQSGIPALTQELGWSYFVEGKSSSPQKCSRKSI